MLINGKRISSNSKNITIGIKVGNRGLFYLLHLHIHLKEKKLIKQKRGKS